MHDDSFARGPLLHEGTLLQSVTFARTVTIARMVTFAQGDIFVRQNFCTASLIARCYICMAIFLQSVTFARSYIVLQKFMHCENYKQ